jgi:hypothetical protein
MFMVATSSFVALNPNAGEEVPSNPTIVFTTYEEYEAEIAQRMLTTRSVVWRVMGVGERGGEVGGLHCLLHTDTLGTHCCSTTEFFQEKEIKMCDGMVKVHIY